MIHNKFRAGHLALASAPALALLITAAGSPPATHATASTRKAASTHKVVDITYWSGHPSGALYKAIAHLVNEFNRTHKDIRVNVKAIYTQDQGLAAFESGKAPNVGLLPTEDAPEFAQAGALVNLKPYIDGKDGLSSAQLKQWFYPAVWNDMTIGGVRYLWPVEKQGWMVIYYNETLFKKAGIKKPPKTWSAIVADAKKITALGSKYHGIAWTPSVRQFFDMAVSDGGTVYKGKVHRTAFALDNKGSAQALSMLSTMVKNGSMILTSGYNYQLDFGTGDIGMIMDRTTGYTYDLAAAGGKFPVGAINSPVGSSNKTSMEIKGASLAMFNTGTSAQKQAAWTFMKWMSAPQEELYWSEHTNYIPLGPEDYKLIQPYWKTHPDQAAGFIPNPSVWWFDPRTANLAPAITAISSVLDKALNGTIATNSALKQMTTVGTQYLSGQLKG